MKTVRFVLFNIAEAALATAWLFYGHEWAGNILKFSAGIVFILSLIVLFLPNKQLVDIYKDEPKKPYWVSYTVDTYIFVSCAAFGHYFLATTFFLSICAAQHIVRVAYEKRSTDVAV